MMASPCTLGMLSNAFDIINDVLLQILLRSLLDIFLSAILRHYILNSHHMLWLMKSLQYIKQYNQKIFLCAIYFHIISDNDWYVLVEMWSHRYNFHVMNWKYWEQVIAFIFWRLNIAVNEFNGWLFTSQRRYIINVYVELLWLMW